MQKQHEDIVTAEAHLTGLMEELEDAMRRQFNAKFKDIKRVFQEVFVELFGGGEARLELTDDCKYLQTVFLTAFFPYPAVFVCVGFYLCSVYVNVIEVNIFHRKNVTVDIRKDLIYFSI